MWLFTIASWTRLTTLYHFTPSHLVKEHYKCTKQISSRFGSAKRAKSTESFLLHKKKEKKEKKEKKKKKKRRGASQSTFSVFTFW